MTGLRLRAAHLRGLARAIEGSLVMTLDGVALQGPDGSRRRLCEAMLARNLHQLHRAADELLDVAFQLSQRADELDRAHRGGAA